MLDITVHSAPRAARLASDDRAGSAADAASDRKVRADCMKARPHERMQCRGHRATSCAGGQFAPASVTTERRRTFITAAELAPRTAPQLARLGDPHIRRPFTDRAIGERDLV